mgnify:CR=1 FL=1
MHAVTTAIAKRLFDLQAKPGVIDNEISKAGCFQFEDLVLDQRKATHFQQRLWQGCRQRQHAGAFAGRKQHHFHVCTRLP